MRKSQKVFLLAIFAVVLFCLLGIKNSYAINFEDIQNKINFLKTQISQFLKAQASQSQELLFKQKVQEQPQVITGETIDFKTDTLETSEEISSELPKHIEGEVIIKFKDNVDIKEGDPITITSNLGLGNKGEEVETLQKMLSKDPTVYPKGLVTGYFGSLTQEAVIRFQEKYKKDILTPSGLTKGTGYVSAATRKKLNSLFPFFKLKTNKSSVNTILNKHKAGVFERVFGNIKGPKIEELNLNKIVKVEIEDDISSVLKDFEGDSNVEYAEPNYLYKTSFIPNDSLYSQQWAHKNTQAELGWDIERGESNIVIAIIDTGVDWQHEDLGDSIWINSDEVSDNGIDDDNNGYIDDTKGWDFTNTSRTDYCSNDCLVPDNDPNDEYGHGTFCAGIAAAVSDNNKGVSGVCPNCKIMALRDAGLEDVKITNAIYYAVNNGARVISMSFGSYNAFSQSFLDAVNYAYSNNVVLVGAAGNDSLLYMHYPAAYDNVMSIAATDSQDKRASFSNYGYGIDVAAPGVDILSTVPKTGALSDPSGYRSLSGTSAAAPYVAGLAGLVLSKKSWSPEQVKNILKDSADRLDEGSYVGSGRVNVAGSLQIDSLKTGKLSVTSVPAGATVFYRRNSTESYSYLGVTPFIADLSIGEKQIKISKTYYIDYSRSVTIAENQTTQVTAELENDPRLTFPMNNDILRAGDLIKIKGTLGSNVESYKIEYAKGLGPQSWVWRSDNITLTNSRKSDEDILANWDTSTMTEPDFYQIKITVQKAGKTYERFSHRVYFDSRIKSGWPVYINHGLTSQRQSSNTFSQPAVSDLDNDGFKEIAFVSFKDSAGAPSPVNLFVYNYDGSLKWSKEIEQEYYKSLVVGTDDIDKDGFMEILLNLSGISSSGFPYGKIYVFNHDGTNLTGWPVDFDYGVEGTVIADLDNNNEKEIITTRTIYDGNRKHFYDEINILNSAGRIINKFEIGVMDTFGDYYGLLERFPTVGNFDDDSDLEIATRTAYNYESKSYKIAVYNMDGTIISGWPQSVAEIRNMLVPLIRNSLVAGDINNDGYDEIIVGTSSNDKENLYVFDKKGNLLSGWPKIINYRVDSSFSLGDFNKDGFLEIVVASGCSVMQAGSGCSKIYLFDYKGQILPGWPITNFYAGIYSSLSIADINNDSFLDVVFSAGGIQPALLQCGHKETSGGIRAWNFDGSQIDFSSAYSDSATLFLDLFVDTAPIITDLENNGKIDIIAYSYDNRKFCPLTSNSALKATNCQEQEKIIDDNCILEKKNRGSIYAIELNSNYNSSAVEWPMFQHDNQRTGRYPKSGAVCTNECFTSGQTKCGPDIYNKQTCGNYDSDECLEWGNTQSCATDTSCGYGECPDTQKPSWFCLNSVCKYNCNYDSSCSSVQSCTDSDGGKDYYVKGIVYGKTAAGLEYNYSDSCSGTDYVQEWYCNNNSPIIDSIFKCTYGCSDGACKQAGKPQIETNNASNIQTNQATFNGNLLSLGGANSANIWFQWGTSISYGQETSHQAKTSAAAFSANISGLSSATTYHFRAVAENSAGIVYGQDKSLITLCANECSTSGQKKCFDNSSSQTCGNYDSDSCLEWSSSQSCATDTSCGYGNCSDAQKPSWFCLNGNCSYNCNTDSSCTVQSEPEPAPEPEPVCTDECSVSGQTKCGPDAYNKQTCGNYDSDPCLEWGNTQSCSGDTSCGYGDCADTQKPSWFCLNGICKYNCNTDSSCTTSCHTSSLWSWNYCSINCKCNSGEGDCDTNSHCNTNYCAFNVGTKYGKVSTMDVCEVKAATCANECSTSGQKKCFDNSSSQTCGNYDSDSCLEWSSSQSCATDTSCGYGGCPDIQKPSWFCSDGDCNYTCNPDTSCEVQPEPEPAPAPESEPVCTNECSVSGQTKCGPDIYNKQTCGNYDSDECLEWGNTQFCVTDTSCGYGECTNTQKPSWFCLNGICKYNCNTDSSCSSVPTCADSDGGKNYYVKGTVSGKTSTGLQYNFSDSCSGTSYINEWYCSNNSPIIDSTFKCTYGCINGMCIEQSEYDMCRLDKLDGSNITRSAIYNRDECLTTLCGVYGPANLTKGIESKCMFNGEEIKRYTR